MATVTGLEKVFTTGKIAALVSVAPRTVSKWFDSGKLKGYRIPGSADRRVMREQLEEFLAANGMPTIAEYMAKPKAKTDVVS